MPTSQTSVSALHRSCTILPCLHSAAATAAAASVKQSTAVSQCSSCQQAATTSVALHSWRAGRPPAAAAAVRHSLQPHESHCQHGTSSTALLLQQQMPKLAAARRLYLPLKPLLLSSSSSCRVHRRHVSQQRASSARHYNSSRHRHTLPARLARISSNRRLHVSRTWQHLRYSRAACRLWMQLARSPLLVQQQQQQPLHRMISQRQQRSSLC